MIFTLEALKAKKGDSLLLHTGTPSDPRLIVIDGGPSGVYRSSLKPRLDAIRNARIKSGKLADDGKLPINLMMVSHIDDDHIRGILDLTGKLVQFKEDREPQPYGVEILWHNSFDDIVGKGSDQLAKVASAEVGAASADGTFPTDKISQHGGLVLASVGQGRALRQNAAKLEIKVNAPAKGLIVADGSAKGKTININTLKGVNFRVLGPAAARVKELQVDWAKKLPAILAKEKGAGAEAAAYLDQSVYNLASIVVLVEVQGKTILLTGDARGDDTIKGAKQNGITLPLHLDILKLPHHGSNRNVEVDFFESFTADHYVISGNGEHGNPDIDTIEMLFKARRGDKRPFTIHLTYQPEEFEPFRRKPYPVAELKKLLASEKKKKTPFTLTTPGQEDKSFKIDLLDPYAGG